ncbi:hypothetical protein [Corynebacterium sp.]|uniref:hypothetical protein n=1 Tax=Corynebacterium sp. TaxID=1720 RepID=UPI003B3A0BC3
MSSMSGMRRWTTESRVTGLRRDRLSGVIGTVDRTTMSEVDMWLRDFLSLP